MFPINSFANLPPVATSSELPELDFKLSVAPNDSIEMAKDIAALANTVGGSIIVGAETLGVGSQGLSPPASHDHSPRGCPDRMTG